MSNVGWMGLALMGLLLGAGLGTWWAGRGARASAEGQVRAQEMARTLKDESASQQAALSAARAEVAQLRATLSSQVEAAGAAQRHEIARLEMHLVGALDELEQLRRQAAARPRSATDTIQDYPATLPMPYQP